MNLIQNMDIKNKTVILRCDFNVPIEGGKILDDSKILKSLKTIDYLQENECKIIILSHLGRVKKEEDLAKNTLKPVAEYLTNIYKEKLIFVDNCRSPELTQKAKGLNAKEILLVENTRHQDFPEKLERFKKIADEVVALDSEYSKLSDKKLAAKTAEFKKRLENGETLEDVLVEAFAKNPTDTATLDRLITIFTGRDSEYPTAKLTGSIPIHSV